MRRTVKELLVEAKDAAELMVDLAYAAVFFADDALAREVMRLEQRMDDLIHELRIVCMVAARTAEDAESLAGVLDVAVQMEAIADAAEDIARVTLKDIGVPAALREDLRHATEVVARVRVHEGSGIVGRPLRELALPTGTGMWVIAVRRDDTWVHGPGGDDRIDVDDVLFLQGPPEGVAQVRALAGALPAHEPPTPGTVVDATASALSNLDRAVDLVVELKNASEVAVGLAYSAILLDDRGLAHEVGVLEDTSDTRFHQLEGWVLRAAAELDDPGSLRGLLHLASASERIVDAARSMCRVVEADGPAHPVLAAALAETDEIVAEAIVAAGSPAEARSLGELRVHVATGMDVLAIDRGGRWTYRPRSTQRLRAGDRLLALGPDEGAERLRGLCGDDRPRGPDGWIDTTG